MEPLGLINDRELLGHHTDGAEVDQSLSKIIVLAIFGIVFSLIFSYFLNLFFSRGNLLFVSISAGAAFLFSISVLLQSIFIKDFWRSILIISIEGLILIAGFYGEINLFVSGSAVVATLLLFLAYWSAKKEMDNMLKINFWRVSKVVLPKAIAALAIFFSFSYVSTVGSGFVFPKAYFEDIFFSSSAIVKNFYPAFNPSYSIKEFAFNSAKDQLNNLPQAKLLSESEKNRLINQSAGEFEARLAVYFGENFNSELKISDAVYDLLSQKFSQLPKNARTLVLFGVAMLIFLIIEGFALPIRWVISLLAYVIFEILLAIDFAVVILEGRSREIIVLK
ncbi:MAG: hypothetical protein AAB596_01515 [Patescibacteria group bacterium]